MIYKDLNSYELADGVTVVQLLTVAKRIVDEWMSQQEGFIK